MTLYEFYIHYMSFTIPPQYFFLCLLPWVFVGKTLEGCESDPWSDMYADYFLVY